jgi:hypothetical protein
MRGIERLTSLLESIYDGYGFSDETGISYFRKYSNELMNFEFGLVLQRQMSLNWDHQYALDFILGTPFLWGSLPGSFWLKLLISPNIRPETSKIIDQISYFADIEFLSRYVGVDALAFLVESTSVSETDKRNTVEYFKKMPYGLVRSNLDAEDLDGVYFADQSLINKLQETLCSNFGFDIARFNENNIHEYIQNLGQRGQV